MEKGLWKSKNAKFWWLLVISVWQISKFYLNTTFLYLKYYLILAGTPLNSKVKTALFTTWFFYSFNCCTGLGNRTFHRHRLQSYEVLAPLEVSMQLVVLHEIFHQWAPEIPKVKLWHIWLYLIKGHFLKTFDFDLW